MTQQEKTTQEVFDVEEAITVPVIAEQLSVEKQIVETGRVRFRKEVQEWEEVVDEPLLREAVTVEHIPINKIWEGEAPIVRHEGDTLIIPVIEEVLVVEKRLMLKEELHVRRQQSTYHDPQTVVLRRDAVTVERVASQNSSNSGE